MYNGDRRCRPHNRHPRRLLLGHGCLRPATKIKLMDASGQETTQHETRGEIFIKRLSIARGYLNNTKATPETFVHDADGGWIGTGDESLDVKRTSP